MHSQKYTWHNKICQYCGEMMTPYWYQFIGKSPSDWNKRKYCDQTCANRARVGKPLTPKEKKNPETGEVKHVEHDVIDRIILQSELAEYDILPADSEIEI